MPSNSSVDKNTEPSRRPLWRRMRPFLRRDLSARLTSACVAVAIAIGLSWLGVSALTRIDSEGARSARIALGFEHPSAVCGGGDEQPGCTFDDAEQAASEQRHITERRTRIALLHELSLRLDTQLATLDTAADEMSRALASGDRLVIDQARDNVVDSLDHPVDLRPVVTESFEVATRRGLVDSLTGPLSASPYHKQEIEEAFGVRELLLRDAAAVVETLLQRDSVDDTELVAVARDRSGVRELLDAPSVLSPGLRAWLDESARTPQTPLALSALIEERGSVAAQAIQDPEASVWHGGLVDAHVRHEPIEVPTVRYRSPITDTTHWRLLGATFFGLASVLLLVVGPVTTAAQTAGERQAGTLPVLRMTGLSAGDLAWAMTVGPNVFAWVAGGTLLILASGILAITTSLAAVALPLALLAIGIALSYPFAIGFGDGLAQRLSPLVVGALLAFVLGSGGFVGSLLVGFDALSVGFFFGPLAGVLGSIAELAGIRGTAWGPGTGEFATASASLVYALAAQAVVAGICLRTWRRRIERAWESLLTPIEGTVLALLSVGASLLTLLDIAARSSASSLDELNLATFLSTAMLLPVLGWLLVASLRRPARAGATADHMAARWAFARFQGVLLVTVVTVALAYRVFMQASGLDAAGAEVMWATLAQVLLLAETAAALVLWIARRRTGKHRIALLGGLIVALQGIAAITVYQLEASYVVRAAGSGWWAVADGTSPYWLAFLVLLWGTGLAMVFTALLRERDRKQADAEPPEPQVDHDDDGMPGRRLIH